MALIFTAKCLRWDLRGVKVSHNSIIELIPFVLVLFLEFEFLLLFDVAIVVSTLGSSHVHNNTNKFILVVTIWVFHLDTISHFNTIHITICLVLLLFSLILFLGFLFVQVLLSVFP